MLEVPPRLRDCLESLPQRAAMIEESTIGPWLSRLKASDAAAMNVVWERFFDALVAYANRHLGEHPHLKGTGEDVAASVFESLWRGCREGRFQNVTSQSELWWTLLKMAKMKCVNHARVENAVKRGGGVAPASLHDAHIGQAAYAALVSQEPDPQYLAAVADELRHCLDELSDSSAREIAALTLEGYTVAEIAARVDLSQSSVRRKLELVRAIWTTRLSED